jgi:hydrogenase nickel incorporation protein HypA/HybF
MHELSVTQSIINISCQEAEKHRANKVKEIKILVGELSGLIPESIQYYFDIASMGTRVEGAKLNIEKVPITVKCNDCGFEVTMERNSYCCKNCESLNIKIVKGTEFLIQSLEVE